MVLVYGTGTAGIFRLESQSPGRRIRVKDGFQRFLGKKTNSQYAVVIASHMTILEFRLSTASTRTDLLVSQPRWAIPLASYRRRMRRGLPVSRRDQPAS